MVWPDAELEKMMLADVVSVRELRLGKDIVDLKIGLRLCEHVEGLLKRVRQLEGAMPKPSGRPTLEEVRTYCAERAALGKVKVDPEAWYDHYESNGWKVGRSAMKDWRAAVRTWEKSDFRSNGKPAPARHERGQNFVEGREYPT